MKPSNRQPGTIISSFKKDEELLNVARSLIQKGYEILATSGTYNFFKEHNIVSKDLSKILDIDNLQDGRVKTLSPILYEALLRKGPLKNNNPLKNIEIVYVNLYPFPKGEDFKKNIELIDIGGITLLRAAAKNYDLVTPFFDANDLLRYLDNSYGKNFKLKMAKKAFYFTSYYDSIIAESIDSEDNYKFKTIALERGDDVRYGENPSDIGNIYELGNFKYNLNNFKKYFKKKNLSFNNYYDGFIGIWAISEFKKPACSIVKHGNPIGVATGEGIEECFEKAYKTDTVSAFGSVITFNRKPSDNFLMKFRENFFEVLILPDISRNGIKILFEKRKNIRILVGDLQEIDFTKTYRGFGGILLENKVFPEKIELQKVADVNKKIFSMNDIDFGLSIIRTYVSNSVILVKNGVLIGAGFGFPNRIEALQRAVDQGKDEVKDSVLISDGFFPFTDSVELAKKYGITVIVQPGGSIKDKKVIKKAMELGIGMYFTGKRYFRH